MTLNFNSLRATKLIYIEDKKTMYLFMYKGGHCNMDDICRFANEVFPDAKLITIDPQNIMYYKDDSGKWQYRLLSK